MASGCFIPQGCLWGGVMKSEMIICEASELSGQLTSLLELLYEKGTGTGLPVNDNVIGLTYSMATRVRIFLMEEEKKQDEEELKNAKPR